MRKSPVRKREIILVGMDAGRKIIKRSAMERETRKEPMGEEI